MIHIAVIGLGQIGGSFVLALRNASIKARITGVDPSVKRRKLLKKHLNASSNRWRSSDQADIVFVCLHFKQLRKFLDQTNTRNLIVDVCSSKHKIVQIANRRRLRMIGGHPMAGNERSGELGWDANLFQNAPFFLCPAGKSSEADQKTITSVLRKIGARPIVVDPIEHDRAVAITSHVPALLARSYIKMAKNIPPHFAGPGFRSFTRPGNCSDDLLQTFLLSNSKYITQAVKQLCKTINGRGLNPRLQPRKKELLSSVWQIKS